MTRRERLTRCYGQQETDRPAIYVRGGFPRGDASYDELKELLATRTELKAGWSAVRGESAYPWTGRTEPCRSEFERKIEVLHTPKGDLCRSTLVSLKGQPGLHETFLVNNAADAEKYLSLPLPTPQGDVASFFEADAAMGDKGIVDIGLGLNPGGFVAELCGSENFAMLSVTDREVLHQLCERQMKVLLRRLRSLLAHSVGPFFSMAGEEYIVPPLHGPRDFRDFNTRYDKPIIDLVHEAGGRMHIHSHGAMRKVFQGFVDAGVDVLHPVEPPPQGDLPAREAKQWARGKMCLEGNLQIHRLYEGSPDEIREETEQLIADAFDDHRGLIVCPSASPYIRGLGRACLPQFSAMVEAVLDVAGPRRLTPVGAERGARPVAGTGSQCLPGQRPA